MADETAGEFGDVGHLFCRDQRQGPWYVWESAVVGGHVDQTTGELCWRRIAGGQAALWGRLKQILGSARESQSSAMEEEPEPHLISVGAQQVAGAPPQH